MFLLAPAGQARSMTTLLDEHVVLMQLNPINEVCGSKSQLRMTTGLCFKNCFEHFSNVKAFIEFDSDLQWASDACLNRFIFRWRFCDDLTFGYPPLPVRLPVLRVYGVS